MRFFLLPTVAAAAVIPTWPFLYEDEILFRSTPDVTDYTAIYNELSSKTHEERQGELKSVRDLSNGIHRYTPRHREIVKEVRLRHCGASSRFLYAKASEMFTTEVLEPMNEHSFYQLLYKLRNCESGEAEQHSSPLSPHTKTATREKQRDARLKVIEEVFSEMNQSHPIAHMEKEVLKRFKAQQLPSWSANTVFHRLRRLRSGSKTF